MESDEEDFVFYGTPIEREEEITSRKKKAVAEASGQLRTLAPWKQEVRDEEGRRRFHGAFTGGFSAGYYNTVGSKEGWIPQSFTSSRKNRAEIKQQSIVNFLDDDEKAELEGHSIGTSRQFDTFGFTAFELARKQAEKEQQQRPSAIPGPVPDELVVPATDSIGVKLLLKMGWRHGHSIKDSRANSLYDARREARKAFLAFSTDEARTQLTGSELLENDLEKEMKLTADDEKKFSNSTPAYVLHPKQDLHGLGYDPFRHAPEFREKKRSRLNENREMGHKKTFSVKDSLFGFKSERIAPGFGIGALEDLDAEDEDVYASGYNFEETYVQEFDEPSRPTEEIKKNLLSKERDILPGFKVASKPDYQMERFDPPIIPKDFLPYHTFSAPLQIDSKFYGTFDTPPEVPPPEDNNLKILVEGMATLVARCGKLFEDLSREKNRSNPLFSFLSGGIGHDYYIRKLWEERQKRNDQTKPLSSGKLFPTVQKMTAETRGKILGEKPLERSLKESSSIAVAADTVNVQINLSDTFTTPASLTDLKEASKPFRDDPAKQERFEQFLKEKYQGGLRSKDVGGSSRLSEAARARERLEFEAAAEAIEKGKHQNSQQLVGVSTGAGLQFTSGGVEPKINQAEESIMKKLYPRREEFQWRPSPVLCKRFDLIDPYMGKPPPAPRARSKMDSLIFMPDLVKATKVEDLASANEERNKEVSDSETKIEVEVENVERPVDLYKAIFSDDDEDEEENSSLNKVDDPEKKIEAANTTLNRLIAGDFLESLGKELGLEVPPDIPPHLDKKAATPSAKKEDNDAVQVESADMATVKVATVSSINQEVLQGQPYYGETTQLSGLGDHNAVDVDMDRNGSKLIESGTLGTVKRKHKREAEEDARARVTSGRRRIRSGCSSEDEKKSRKHSRHHRDRSSNSDSDATDISDDYQDRQYSRSKDRKEGSSREKGSSRRHSKHHKHGSRYSPRISTRHGSDKEQREGRKEKRK